MKEIIKKKMVETEDITFVAEDGKEFKVGEKGYSNRTDAERDCKIYERQLKGDAITNDYKRLVTNSFSGDSLTLWLCEDGFMDKVYLEKEADLYTVTAYYKWQWRAYDDYGAYEDYTDFNKFSFPCDAMVFGNDGWVECRPISEMEKDISNFKRAAIDFLGITAKDLKTEENK